MQDIRILIQSAMSQNYFSTPTSSQNYLNNLEPNDQLALITAMYIGRDHFHSDTINDDYLWMIKDNKFNRSWHSDIPQADYARMLYEKQTNLPSYYQAFIRCTSNSNFDLSKF